VVTNGGNLTLLDSTFFRNRVVSHGGMGGAVCIASGGLKGSNSIFGNNFASYGSAFFLSGGLQEINNSTLFLNEAFTFTPPPSLSLLGTAQGPFTSSQGRSWPQTSDSSGARRGPLASASPSLADLRICQTFGLMGLTSRHMAVR
jgi:hypothetical protein